MEIVGSLISKNWDNIAEVSQIFTYLSEELKKNLAFPGYNFEIFERCKSKFKYIKVMWYHDLSYRSKFTFRLQDHASKSNQLYGCISIRMMALKNVIRA